MFSTWVCQTVQLTIIQFIYIIWTAIISIFFKYVFICLSVLFDWKSHFHTLLNQITKPFFSQFKAVDNFWLSWLWLFNRCYKYNLSQTVVCYNVTASSNIGKNLSNALLWTCNQLFMTFVFLLFLFFQLINKSPRVENKLELNPWPQPH